MAETATQPGADAITAPALHTDHQDAADFQQLYDAMEQQDENERPDLNNAGIDGEEAQGDEAQGAERPKVEAEEAAAAEGAEAAEKPAEGQSLEDFYKEHGQDPFLNLRFKVKVDGAESEVPLSELIRDRQLAAASYARMEESARARQQFTTEQTQVRQALGVQIKQAQELMKVAQDSLLRDFNSIDWNHLRVNDPANYSALYTDFQARNASIQQTLQQIAQAESANAQAADTQRTQALAQERERLFTTRPEWRDPVKGQAAHQAIRAMGQKLGFTDAELAGITDHRMLIGLHQLAELSAQAQQRQAAIPRVLKRVRAAPQMAAPGARHASAPRGAGNQKLEDAWLASGGRNDQLGAAVFERFVE